MVIMPNKTSLEITCDPTTNGKWTSTETDLSSLLECTDPEPIVPHYDDFENHQRNHQRNYLNSIPNQNGGSMIDGKLPGDLIIIFRLLRIHSIL